MNVQVREFGLLGHNKHKYLGASPDGIVSEYKFDGKHKTKLVGRMLEIKCPPSRKIEESDDPKIACPDYYLQQVLQQLEVCDLDECDFWQCKIVEYSSREEYLKDTYKNEPFRSKETMMERGVLIQILPRDKKKEDYNTTVWEYAKFIHPPKINMTPYEYDLWIAEEVSNVNNGVYSKYFVDRIIYWRLEQAHCVTIKRDPKWFEKALPIFEKTWKNVEYFRNNSEIKSIFKKYLDSVGLLENWDDKRYNSKYFESKICKITNDLIDLQKIQKDSPEYDNVINTIKNEIEENKLLLKKGELFDKFKLDKYPNRKVYKKRTPTPNTSENENNGEEEFEIVDMDN
jgi:hypothetical protein